MKSSVSFFSKNWLVKKIGHEFIEGAAKKYASGKLLDIGCGEKPFKEMFSPYVEEHIGLDHEGTFHSTENVDLIGTAYEIPAEDCSFDTVLCTAALEHLEEPGLAISEANRILKNDGVAIYTVPFFWHTHEAPRDFYRYSKYGLEYLFKKNGFDIIEIQAFSGFWVTFGQEFVYYIHRFKGRLISKIVPTLGGLIQQICYLLNKYDQSEEFTWMHLIVVRKNTMWNKV